MTLSDIEVFSWFGAWQALTNDVERQFLETELTTTLHPDHILYKRPLTAIAERRESDDVLFLVRGRVTEGRIDENAVEIARVCLSYSTERTADIPQTTIFPSLVAWQEEELRGISTPDR